MSIRVALTIGLAFILGACAGAPRTEGQKESLSSSVKRSLDLAKANDSTFGSFFDSAYAFAVLPSVGKGGFIIGGAGGDGEVFKGGMLMGYCSMGQGTIGATIGGQAFDEFIVFQNESSYNRFVLGQFTMTAQVSAVMVTAGAAASAGFKDGVAVFINNVKGAMVEAAVGGQQFNFTPLTTSK